MYDRANFTIIPNKEIKSINFDVYCDPGLQAKHTHSSLNDIQTLHKTSNNTNTFNTTFIPTHENPPSPKTNQLYDQDNESSDDLDDDDETSASGFILNKERTITIVIATVIVFGSILIKSMLVLFNQK